MFAKILRLPPRSKHQQIWGPRIFCLFHCFLLFIQCLTPITCLKCPCCLLDDYFSQKSFLKAFYFEPHSTVYTYNSRRKVFYANEVVTASALCEVKSSYDPFIHISHGELPTHIKKLSMRCQRNPLIYFSFYCLFVCSVQFFTFKIVQHLNQKIC